jgi:hypothetical protein
MLGNATTRAAISKIPVRIISISPEAFARKTVGARRY